MIDTFASMIACDEAIQALPRLLKWSSRVNSAFVAHHSLAKKQLGGETDAGYPWAVDDAHRMTKAFGDDDSSRIFSRRDDLQMSPISRYEPAYALSPDASELPLPDISSQPSTGFHFDRSQVPIEYVDVALEDCIDKVGLYPDVLDFGEQGWEGCRFEVPIVRWAACEVICPKPVREFKVKILHEAAVKELEEMIVEEVAMVTESDAAGEVGGEVRIGWDDASDDATKVEGEAGQASLSSADSTFSYELESGTSDTSEEVKRMDGSLAMDLIRVGKEEDGEAMSGMVSSLDEVKVPEDGDLVVWALPKRLASDSGSSSQGSPYDKPIQVDLGTTPSDEKERDEPPVRRTSLSAEAIQRWRSTIEV